MCTHDNGNRYEILIKARDRVELIGYKGGQSLAWRSGNEQVVCVSGFGTWFRKWLGSWDIKT